MDRPADDTAVECPGCGKWHPFTKAGFAVVVTAFARGLLQTMTPNGPEPLCLLQAFAHDEIADMYQSATGRRKFQ